MNSAVLAAVALPFCEARAADTGIWPFSNISRGRVEAFLDGKKTDPPHVKADGTSAVVTAKGSTAAKDVHGFSPVLKPASRIPVTARLTSAEGNKAVEESVKLQSVDKYDSIAADIKGKPGGDRVGAAMRRIDAITQPQVRTGDIPDTPELKNALAEGQAALTAAYKGGEQSKDPLYRTRVASIFQRLSSERKAIYGYDDNFVPDVYDAIFQRTKSCVGIVHPDKQDGKPPNAWRPNVSGVLIAPNLVLTCAHDITSGVLDGQLIVLFDYQKDINGKEKPHTQSLVTKIVYNGWTNVDGNSEPIDFSLMEIDPPMPDRPIVALTRVPVALDTSIYVIGHPKGEFQTVHDNSHVLYPYEVTVDDLPKLKLRVHAAIIGGSNDTAGDTDRLFEESYVRTNSSNGGVNFRYILQTDGRRLPVMGADCDTFHGDSGGAAFLRNSSDCCGILVEGEPDTATFALASFLHHEKIVPLRAIHERLLDKKIGLQGWPGQYKVTVH